MGRLKKILSAGFIASLIFALGGLTAIKLPQLKNTLSSLWYAQAAESWDKRVAVLEIPVNDTTGVQLAYAYLPKSIDLKPLVVSLHAWADDYSQADPLSTLIVNESWNYIHPDFQGPNWTKDACLSAKALADIDAAIDYAIQHGSVDLDNIFIVGASGGGYATLGTYLKSKHKIKGFQSWVPISDLSAWYYQTSDRNYKFADDILKCTSSGKQLNKQKADERSPLFWDVEGAPNGTLDIYAGITDGYTGSVPISHSIDFYNKLALEYGFPEAAVSDADTITLLTRGPIPQPSKEFIGGRELVFSKNTPNVSVNIFQGGHEILRDHVMLRIKQLYNDSNDAN